MVTHVRRSTSAQRTTNGGSSETRGRGHLGVEANDPGELALFLGAKDFSFDTEGLLLGNDPFFLNIEGLFPDAQGSFPDEGTLTYPPSEDTLEIGIRCRPPRPKARKRLGSRCKS